MAKKINVKGPIVDNDTGLIYHWIGFSCCCPKDVERALKEAAGEDVVLEINSPGGYCDMGSEIYTMLQEYEGNVEAHIICAASAATVIACGADKVLMSDTGIFMIHNSSCSASGDYRDMFSTGDALLAYNESIINAYVRKTGKSREELKSMMDYTTWMSARDAIEKGFADGYILGDPNEKPDPEDEPDKKDLADSVLDLQIANAAVPIIEKSKALELLAMMRSCEEKNTDSFDLKGATEALKSLLPNNGGNISLEVVDSSDAALPGETIETQNDSSDAVSDRKNNEGGKESMTLEELLNEHPEARAEYDATVEDLAASAREEGVSAENARLKALDDIAKSVSAEALEDAKYGENPKDAKTLALEAMLDDSKKAANYMAHAKDDSKESGVDDVGSSAGDEEPSVEDELAAHVNSLRRK